MKDEMLNKLHNPILKELAFKIYENFSNIFKMQSSYNNHHPEDERKEYGLLLHSKRVVLMSLHLLQKEKIKITNDVLDILIFSGFFHDVPYKHLLIDGKFISNKSHALDNAKFFENVFKEIDFDKKMSLKILSSIAYHMGEWNDYSSSWYFNIPNTKESLLIKEADFIVSKDFLQFNSDIDNEFLKIFQKLKEGENKK